MDIPALYWIPLLPLLGAAFNLLLGRKLPRWAVETVGCVAVAGAAVVTVHAVLAGLWLPREATGRTPALRYEWFTWLAVGGLKVQAAFALDALSAVMALVITLVGLLIHLYSVGYMADERRPAAYFGYLNLFTGAMLLLVLGDSLPLLFVGWEGVGLCSFLLIGFWYENPAYATAGRKAFIVNRVGDFGFLLGVFLLLSVTGTLQFSELQGHVLRLRQPLWLHMPAAFWIGLCLFLGACGKSAQVPLYVWLPDAMAGPTPVSALIHAATMVTAGVYMIARLHFLFECSATVMGIVAGVGVITAFLAATIGLVQTDLKKVLAYSTVSQLGFMFVAVGCGAYTAAIFHLVTHALFKAGLFLGAGSVMHACSNKTDMLAMGGLRKKLPWTHATSLIYCLAIAGAPLTSGFFSKDEILAGAWAAHIRGWPAWGGKLLWATLLATALLTATYMFRMYYLVFGGRWRGDHETGHHVHESPAVMTGPLGVLAFGALFGGLLGLPGEHSFLGHWLAPVLGAHGGHFGGEELALMGAATTAALVGWLIAFSLYRSGPSDASQRVAASFGPLRSLAVGKYYVDELYAAAIVRPLRWVAHALYDLVDRFAIDTVVVGGVPSGVDSAGRLLRTVQNGDIHRYIAGVLVGAAIFMALAGRPSSDIKAELTKRHLTVQAAGAGDGPLIYRWDFNGDGAVDSEGPSASFDYPGPGRYPLRLEAVDPRWGLGLLCRSRTTHVVEVE
jgi:NADH-quinone oxidoreductase subunit L